MFAMEDGLIYIELIMGTQIITSRFTNCSLVTIGAWTEEARASVQFETYSSI